MRADYNKKTKQINTTTSTRKARPPTTTVFPSLEKFHQLALAVKNFTARSQIPQEFASEIKWLLSWNHGVVYDMSTQIKREIYVEKKVYKYTLHTLKSLNLKEEWSNYIPQ